MESSEAEALKRAVDDGNLPTQQLTIGEASMQIVCNEDFLGEYLGI